MNRKNLTAAVLAGLAGAAGIAGTAQAVNLNPDGLGQVLIYPYYTSNDGNETLLSVVNTTDSAKAVKVRFKEGYNSREVLDFNMYMSAWDVWVAAIADREGTPTLFIPDTTCTVPYLYQQDTDGDGVGEQEFLPYDYSGDRNDNGPEGIDRAAEGYFEMIEMGTLTNDSETAKRLGSADAATHVIDDDGNQDPADCQQLVDNWTENLNGSGSDGMWLDTNGDPGDEGYIPRPQDIDISRNSGGLFGGAAIINGARGTMYAYNARAIQGFDKRPNGNHFVPANEFPSLTSGSENDATIFFGVPQNKAVTLSGYPRGVDAVSAVFMHEYTMNEYAIEAAIGGASEWVVTFPTKNFYVDSDLNDLFEARWVPDSENDEVGCLGWDEGEPFPGRDGPNFSDQFDQSQTDWAQCTYIDIGVDVGTEPFTSIFNDDGEACEEFKIEIWDREENSGDGPNNPRPPIVSPPPPGGGSNSDENVLCYEVNVMRFGNDGVFGSVFGTTSPLLKTVDTGAVPYDNGTKFKPRLSGWARIDWGFDSDHVDYHGLVGLPVTGFWAEQFANAFLGDGADVLANYGGLFDHKGNVRRVSPSYAD
jgi:hypothetical protein